MLSKTCRICLKVVDRSEELNKNWLYFTHVIKNLFKIDLKAGVSSDKKIQSEFGSCFDCNEKLRDTHKFYATILNAQKQLNETQTDAVTINKRSLKSTSLVPPKKRKIKSSPSQIPPKKRHISSSPSIDHEPTPKDTEKKQKVMEEDLKIAQFFLFSCKDCPSLSFHRFVTYQRHMKRSHNISRPAITCCKQRFSKRCRLIEHMSYHLNPEKFKCPECGRQFTAKDRIENHRKQRHGPKECLSYECDKCGKRFRVRAALKAHLMSHLTKDERETLKTHICDMCGSKFITKFLLVQHMRQVHIKPAKFVCDICAKVYKNKSQFLYHSFMGCETVHIDTSGPKVQCLICNQFFLNENSLKAHIRTVHADDGPHICDICKKEAPTSRALKAHKAYMHENARRFACSYCEKAFKRGSELKEHMTRHVGGALYRCTFCDKTFNSSANMYSHRKKMHPEEHKKYMNDKKNGITPESVPSKS